MDGTRLKKASLFAGYLLILTMLFVAGAELILRQRGIKPWRTDEVAIHVDPGGRFFRPDPALGYTHIPGHFIVTLGKDYSFSATNLPNTLRITHPLETYGESTRKKEIWIFGCSYTYGWSLNDDETYPWLLQTRLPQYEIVNFGVSGYGTIHSLIQFREALKTRTPKAAILAYAGFHDVRNTFLRERQKDVAPWNKLGPLVQPYARLDRDGRLQYALAKVEFSEFPLMRTLALAHFVEMKYDQYEDRFFRSHAVSEKLVLEMARLACDHGIRFIVANIRDGQPMLDYARANAIPVVDISVDLNQPENRSPDGHPSAIADKRYADSLEAFLRGELER